MQGGRLSVKMTENSKRDGGYQRHTLWEARSVQEATTKQLSPVE